MSLCEHCRRPCSAASDTADTADSETAAPAALADGITPSRTGPLEDAAAQWETAIHEAGHAVLAVLAGGFIDSATILPGEGYRGIVRWRQARRSAYLETRIINSLAGAAAGDLALKGIDPTEKPIRLWYDDSDHAILTGMMEHRPSDTCRSDYCEAISFAIERRPDATLASLRLDLIRSQVAVGTIISDPRVWGAIDAVARKLLSHGTCSDADIRPIVAERAGGTDLLTLMRSCRLPLRL